MRSTGTRRSGSRPPFATLPARRNDAGEADNALVLQCDMRTTVTDASPPVKHKAMWLPMQLFAVWRWTSGWLVDLRKHPLPTKHRVTRDTCRGKRRHARCFLARPGEKECPPWSLPAMHGRHRGWRRFPRRNRTSLHPGTAFDDAALIDQVREARSASATASWNAASSSARTGTHQCIALAKATHLTASFSVMSTGRPSSKVTSAGAIAW